MRCQLRVQRRAVSTSTIEPSRLAGTSLPKVDNRSARRVRQDSVSSVSSVRAVTVVHWPHAANPSSSTVRLVVDTTLGTESAASVIDTVAVERVAVLVGDRVGEAVRAGLAGRRRVGEGAVAVIDRRALGRPPSSPQPPSPGRRRRRRTRRCRVHAERDRRVFRRRKRTVIVRLRHVVDDRDVEAALGGVGVLVGDLNRHPASA